MLKLNLEQEELLQFIIPKECTKGEKLLINKIETNLLSGGKN